MSLLDIRRSVMTTSGIVVEMATILDEYCLLTLKGSLVSSRGAVVDIRLVVEVSTIPDECRFEASPRLGLWLK